MILLDADVKQSISFCEKSFVEQPIKFKELDFCSSTLSLWRKVFTANCFLFCQLAPASDSQWEDPWQRKCLLRPSFLLRNGKKVTSIFYCMVICKMSDVAFEVIIFHRENILVKRSQSNWMISMHSGNIRVLFLFLFFSLTQQSCMNALLFCVDTHITALCQLKL